jgi:hypothetical protein
MNIFHKNEKYGLKLLEHIGVLISFKNLQKNAEQLIFVAMLWYHILFRVSIQSAPPTHT